MENEIKVPCEPCKQKGFVTYQNQTVNLDNRMTAFIDCGGKSVVWRIPYEYAIEILSSLKESKNRAVLRQVTTIAARRSSSFFKLMAENNLLESYV